MAAVSSVPLSIGRVNWSGHRPANTQAMQAASGTLPIINNFLSHMHAHLVTAKFVPGINYCYYELILNQSFAVLASPLLSLNMRIYNSTLNGHKAHKL